MSGSSPSPEATLQSKLEQISNERFIHYDLERFQSALKAAGNPEKNVKTLIIAGTNGKGTTTLLVSAGLMEAGMRVGTYLSPHLHSPTERLLLNLVPIAATELTSLVEEHRALAEKFRLTYFEYLTLLTFIWASRQHLDFLVLEVGLGGRLDATNVTDPVASVITTIDWDHQQWLGNSLEAIFDEKFAVVRPESLCFSGIRQRSLRERLVRACDAIDTIYYLSSELRATVTDRDWYRQQLQLNGHHFSLSSPTPGSRESLLLAFLTLRIVFPKIPTAVFQNGFARVRNPGRFEVVQSDPLVVLSGDHNPAGIECLESTLQGLPRKGRLKILCAFSPDKPFAAMYERLKGLSDEITLTLVPRLRESLPQSYFEMAKVAEDPRRALEEILTRSSKDDVILVTGSLYLVGEVRSFWRTRAEFLGTPRLIDPPSASPRDGSNPAKSPPAEAARRTGTTSPGAGR